MELRKRVRALRRRQLRRAALDQPSRWRRPPLKLRAFKWGLQFVTFLLVVFAGRSAYVVLTGEPQRFLIDPDKGCRDTGFSCGVISGLLLTALPLAVGSLLFLLWRLKRVPKAYVKRARNKPEEIVETAGNIIGEIVGRDHLCDVIMADLLDEHGRRPHVIVGGVGIGKTAVLVKLASVLAERGAVPVPIKLRDAEERLDFRSLARQRFVEATQDSLLSDAEGEKVWRRLRRDDQVVILADGLEEALSARDSEGDRDTHIRLAISAARREGLPLVVASRPHDPLRGLDAAVVQLEPLSEEAALDYIAGNGSTEDEHRLRRVVKTADVAETPLYLQIARELQSNGLLHPGHPDHLDTRGVDRMTLRVRLMDTWMKALINGFFKPEVPLSSDVRSATITHLAALACVGLANDTLEVAFDDFEPETKYPSQHEENDVLARIERTEDDAFIARLTTLSDEQTEKLARARSHDKLRAARAAALEGLDADARAMDVRLAATRAMHLDLVEAHSGGVRFPHSIMQAYLGSTLIRGALLDRDYLANALREPSREILVALVMFSRTADAALNYDGDDVGPRGEADRPTWRGWLRDKLLDAAKNRTPADHKSLDLFSAALEIDSVDSEPNQEEIARELRTVWTRLRSDDRTVDEAKLRLIARFGEAGLAIIRGGSDAHPAHPAYGELFEIARAEKSYPIRLAAAQEIGAGGDHALVALRDRLSASQGEHGAPVDANPLRAWILPLLATSVRQEANRDEVIRRLDELLALVRSNGTESRIPLSFEAALAQGFKHAANRKPPATRAEDEAREALKERARDMLRNAHWWFSRLTLLHALCLWHLREPEASGGHGDEPDLNPIDLVEHWLRGRDGEPERHPFVIEAAALAVQALETGEPERFIWIDESGVATRVGSRSTGSGSSGRQHSLWIPPSTGWSALVPEALRLVADVLILLNLAERGQTSAERDRRRRRANRDELPPCLTQDRGYLAAGRTVGTAENSAPGANCPGRCDFELCPYPPKGEQTYRSELSEAFCRQQQIVARRRQRGTWLADLDAKSLKEFWEAMESRARR